MILADVNVLVEAHRREAPNHELAKDWLEATLGGRMSFGTSEWILLAVFRITTDRRIYSKPSPAGVSLEFLSKIRFAPNTTILTPGPRFWSVFEHLVDRCNVRGALTTDALLAALAIEHDCTLYSFDKDFGRFPGLNWRKPE